MATRGGTSKSHPCREGKATLCREHPARPLIYGQKDGRFYSGKKLPKILICDVGVGLGLCEPVAPEVAWRGESLGFGGAWLHLNTVLGKRNNQSGQGWSQVSS